ncbi:zeta toxin family protein, partial [Schaalia naturae]
MSGKLDPQVLRERFGRYVVPDYVEPQRGGAGAVVSGPPRFVSVGGQPGAGKGGVLSDVQRSLPGAVIINGDELRRFHPDYARLMREEPLRMPEVTSPASGAWVGMATAYLRGQRISAVVETTLRDAAMLGGEFEAFKAVGYKTELRVVAVPLEVSRAGILSRYIEQVERSGTGRWTPGAAHDMAAANVRGTVHDLVASGVVDRVVVQNREGRVFHDAVVSAGGREFGEVAALAVDEARDVRSLSVEQARSWVEYTTDALHARAWLGEVDADVMRVVDRLATRDAAAVVVQAWPGDVARQ